MSKPKVWSLSPSVKLLLFIVPLILVTILFSVAGSKSPGRILLSGYSWLRSSTSSSSSESAFSFSAHESINGTVPEVAAVDLEPPRRVADVGFEKTEEDAVFSESDGASTFSSDSPAPAPAPVEILPEAETRDFSRSNSDTTIDISNSSPVESPAPNAPVLNQSLGYPDKAMPLRMPTKLDKLEARLNRARVVIRDAKWSNSTTDPDYNPIGPMYLNANVFHRSYLEMEKQFRIFVYKEGEPPVFHNGPCKSIYSMEGNFIHMLEVDNKFRTRDPEKAQVFFLPFSVTMLVRYVYVRDSHDFSSIKHTVKDYIDVLSTKYLYWNRSLGADHFMLACHDWGPETSKSEPNLRKNSIRVLCNANTSEGFNPTKDASFPEINLQTGGMQGLVGGPSPSRRAILAFFAGGIHGPIRPVLLDHWENKGDPDMRIHQYLPRGISYYDMMRKSKFCICPSGYEVASPRVVEAIYTGCVPVLVSDHYVPPFSDVLNWKAFSVEVPVREIPNLKRILEGISPSQYIRMQRRVVQVRRHFEVNSPPKRFDVFHMILHSVWLRRLNVRLRDT